ncbi:MAG: hypothetical protein F6K54_11615 [Okeania sp. SIO3B5]|uniref:hypothetical protein n=1 Tax=Okeania sp. SIO3B5 TaxID=2607811 RepID=UPI0013FEDAE7|nr:hypothetical protein [Okeania sp. SIO3B5]NEO53670.1 hypothetical protein [Okeania sp. SIO3B5]
MKSDYLGEISVNFYVGDTVELISPEVLKLFQNNTNKEDTSYSSAQFVVTTIQN